MMNAATVTSAKTSLLAIGTATAQPGGAGGSFDLLGLLTLAGEPGGLDVKTAADPRQLVAATGKRLPVAGLSVVAAPAVADIAPADNNGSAAEIALADTGDKTDRDEDALGWIASLVPAPQAPLPLVVASDHMASPVPTDIGTAHPVPGSAAPGNANAGLAAAISVGAAARRDADGPPPVAPLLATMASAPVVAATSASSTPTPAPRPASSTGPTSPPAIGGATLSDVAGPAPVAAVILPASSPTAVAGAAAPAPAPSPSRGRETDAVSARIDHVARMAAGETTVPIVRIDPAAAPGATPIAPATTATAAQLFGDALRLARRERRGDDADPAATTLGATGIATHAHTAVAPAQQGALDMRSDTWPRAMIERIDALRDAANAMDTSIRLHPDALGTIDVSVRKEGDAVHVNLSAEQAATRQLLADAQPRLTQLAEERGLKLAQASVDGGASGQFADARQQPRAPMPHQPAAPASAGNASAELDDDLSTRIA